MIYDAEDRPEPDQLSEAVVAFRAGGDELVCVQARLNYFNARENLLTRMFTLEYWYWFDYMLPGLDALRLPIPLGGTSNHFRTSVLTELGGWDAWNVTEDADLGIRASALGFRVGVVNSTTMERGHHLGAELRRATQPLGEGLSADRARPCAFATATGPPNRPAPGPRFRPAHRRHPGKLPRCAAVLRAHRAHPAGSSHGAGPVHPGVAALVCMVNFLTGTAIMVYLSMMGPYKRGTFTLIPWAFLNPVYWILHSFASYKALWQLVSRPHYWEKTNHGLTHVQN